MCKLHLFHTFHVKKKYIYIYFSPHYSACTLTLKPMANIKVTERYKQIDQNRFFVV